MGVLAEQEIAERLAAVPHWARDGDSIVHAATLADFKAAMLYVGAVAYLAETANHHPDIAISWNKVTLTLSTHSAGGLTEKDFSMAEQISRLPLLPGK
jgi:4a-hydroxytetrahydrobiopterin dehydratase